MALGAAGEYRTAEIESLKITIDSEWVPRTAPGYLPVRFEITNLGEARVIEIVGQGSRFFRGRSVRPASMDVRQVVSLARGDRVRLTIPVPVFADNENIRFEVREGGRALERFNFTGFQSKLRPDEASALVVADPATPFGEAAGRWVRKMGPMTFMGGTLTSVVTSGTVTLTPAPSSTTSGPTGAARPLDFLLHPARLPSNWLGFTSVRAVVMGPREWEQLNDAQKSALLTWTACGGDLIFVDGAVASLFPGGHRLPAASLDGAAGAYLFGRIHLMSSASIEGKGLAAVLSKTAPLQDANWSLPANRAADWGTITSRGFRLPIPGVGSVPARAYLSILFLFALLIGPANYWLLWRRRRQALLVLTTPIISAVFILLLGGYVLAGEGLGVRGRAVSFTMLDQGTKEAVTRASVTLYAAGMTPGGGLRFARDVAVFPIGTDGTGTRERLSLDLTEAQRFGDGLMQARSPANLETIGFRTVRERLTFSREAGGVRVTNGLGAPIRDLIYREGNVIYSAAEALAAGAQGILKPEKGRPSGVVPPGLPQSARFEHLFDHLPDGAYLAVLERSPFWNPGVARLEERDSFHVVFGWVTGQP